jgi:hypothetical protein
MKVQCKGELLRIRSVLKSSLLIRVASVFGTTAFYLWKSLYSHLKRIQMRANYDAPITAPQAVILSFRSELSHKIASS